MTYVEEKWRCVKCREDAEGSYQIWIGGGGPRLCDACAAAFVGAFQKLLGTDDLYAGEYGIEVSWHIIENVLPDEARFALEAERADRAARSHFSPVLQTIYQELRDMEVPSEGIRS